MRCYIAPRLASRRPLRAATRTLRLALPACTAPSMVALLAAPVRRGGGTAWLEQDVLVLRGPARVINNYAVTLSHLADL